MDIDADNLSLSGKHMSIAPPFSSMDVDVEDHAASGNDFEGPEYALGDIVDVMPRMWAGINKPGGVGRVKSVTYDEEEEEHVYSVRYVHGGLEKNISGVHINIMDMGNKQQRGTKGRCTWCRCFIRDCRHDQEKDPYFVEPVRVVEEPPLYFSADQNSLPTVNRKRLAESVDPQQPKKQKPLRNNRARRLASEATEKEFETAMLAMARRLKLLPDDEDAAVEDDLSGDEYDFTFRVKASNRGKRIVMESDEEKERELELPVDVWDVEDSIAASVRAAPGSATASSTLPLTKSTETVQSVTFTKPVLATSQHNEPVRSTSTSLAPSSRVIDLSNDVSLVEPAPQEALLSHEEAARRLHASILRNCLGPAENSRFINNSENAHNDRDPADVSRTFKALIKTVSTLCEAEKIHLYVLTYSWFEARLAKAIEMSAKLDDLEARVKALETGLKNGDNFATPLDDEITNIEAKLERFEWRLTVIFEELERVGFDVFTRLRNIKHPDVRSRTVTVDSWGPVVCNTKVSLHHRFRQIRDDFEDAEAAWSLRANSYDDSDDEEYPEPVRAPFTVRPAVSRVRDAALEAGTIVRASSTTSTGSGSVSRPAGSSSRADRTAGALSRTSTGNSYKSPRDSNQSNTSAPKRSRRSDGDYAINSSYDDDFIDNTEYVPRADGQGDEAVLTGFEQNGRHHGAKGHGSGKYTSTHKNGGESRNISDGRNPLNRVPSRVQSKPAQQYSKRVQRELGFIFGPSENWGESEGTSREDRRSELETQRSVFEGRVNSSEIDQTRSIAPRVSAPSVLDLPRHIRYHGRVTVLESLVSGMSTLPPLGHAPQLLQPVFAAAAFNDHHRVGEYHADYDDYSGPSAPSAGPIMHTSHRLNSASSVDPPRRLEDLNERFSPVYDMTIASNGEFDSDIADESLLDVVLSSMANPYLTTPPLHTRCQFYQLSALGIINPDAVDAVGVWAEQFVAQLAQEANAVPGNKDDTPAMTATIVSSLSQAVVSTVQNLLQRIASHEEMVSRSSQLHENHIRASGGAKFNAASAFNSLVKLVDEKLTKLSEVFDHVVKLLFAPSAESDCAGRSASIVLLVEIFSSVDRIIHGSGVVDRGEDHPPRECHLRSFLRRSTLVDSKCAALSSRLACNVVRMKIAVLKSCALHTVNIAKARPVVDASDTFGVMERMEIEAADWDVMNHCFEQLLAVQSDLVAALLGNNRLLLTVLHCLSVIPSHDIAASVAPSLDISGVAKLVTCALYDTLSSLRACHVIINAARTASVNGVRVWAWYEASREQANGVIATYPKNTWRAAILTIYAHIAHTRGRPLGGSGQSQLCASVNPVVLLKRVNSVETVDEQCFEEDVIWAMMTVFTHCLRTVKVADSTDTATRGTCRVDGAWSLLRGLTQVTTQAAVRNDLSPGSRRVGTERITRLLRRVGHFAALWSDSSSDATALALHVVSQMSPQFSSLLPIHPPLASNSITSVACRGVPALESKSVLFLSYHAFFGARLPASQAYAGELGLRKDLSRQLSYIVAMMFEAFKVPHGLLLQGQTTNSALVLDSISDLAATTEQSLLVLRDIRMAFKDIFYNSHTEACVAGDVTTIAANLASIKTAATKLPRTHQKLPLMALLDRTSSVEFQRAVLFGVVAELTSFFGADAVRQKLKVTSVGSAVATPLQHQLMDVLSNKFASTSSSSDPAGVDWVAVSSAIETRVSESVTLSEIDRLLQKVPLQQQNNQQCADPTTSTTTATSPSIEESALLQCLLWYAGLVTLAPFPVDASICASIAVNSTVQEADLKRIVDSQNAEMAFVQPLMHLLQHSLRSQQSNRDSFGLPGVKKLVEASFGASLAASATILRHIDSVSTARHAIRIDSFAEESADVHSHLYRVSVLHTSLISEVLNVVHACLAVTSKDGLQYSAAYVMSTVILHLHGWHQESRRLLSAAQCALNIDESARNYLTSAFVKEDKKLSRLLGEVLRVRTAPYKSTSNVGASKPSGSELIGTFRTLLLSLSNSLKSLEVCGLDFSSEFSTLSTAEFAGITTKYKVHKNNFAPGCCFALCKSLGALTSLLLDVNHTPSANLESSAFVQAVVSEIVESLERVDQAASMVSANGLLGNWLKITFWAPILRSTEVKVAGPTASATELSFLSPFFPALVCAWVGCAVAGASSHTLRSVAQQIELARFYESLVMLSPVLVRALRSKCGTRGVHNLTAPELQCLRLAELFVQVCLSENVQINAFVAAEKFLRVLAAGSMSSVLSELLTCSTYAGVVSCSFPASHRAAFESVNVQLSREVLKGLHVINFTIFRYGGIASRAAEKLTLQVKAAGLKSLFCDISYLYRVLVAPAAPRASLYTPPRGYGETSSKDGILSAQVLRSVPQLPRMVTLDQCDAFLTETVDMDSAAAVSCMFKCALKGPAATAEDRNNLKVELKRNFLCNVPKYLLLASDTPYSTRQTAWRVILAPLLLTPAHTALGVYVANHRANKLSSHNAAMPMLVEATIGEEAYVMLLVCALTLALPVPEQLARLVPAMRVSGDFSLRTKFVELVNARLKLPIKQVTLWELYAQLVAIVTNTCDDTTAVASTGEGETHDNRAQQQDVHLTRFKQYLLLGGGSSTQAGAGGSVALGENLVAHNNTLWEHISNKAQSLLAARVAEEQQRQSLEKRGAFQSAVDAMCLLPWASVRNALHLHSAALEDVLRDFVAHVTDDRGASKNSPPITTMSNSAPEKEELLSLIMCSTCYLVRSALVVTELHTRVSSEFSFITESSKKNLQALLQYCRLASESVSSTWAQLRVVNSVQAAENSGEETEIVGLWTACLQHMGQILRLETNMRSSLRALVMCCWQLLQTLYRAASCHNVLLVGDYLSGPAPTDTSALLPAPPVGFSTSLCMCSLCTHALNGEIVYDGTENLCSVQALQRAVLQVHRALSVPHQNDLLTAEQSMTLRNELSVYLTGSVEDFERVFATIVLL